LDGEAQSLHAAHPGGTGELTVTVSPLTELGMMLLEGQYLTAAQIAYTNDVVSEIFAGDLFQSVGTHPVDITNASNVGAPRAQREYGLFLAALSQAAVDTERTTQNPRTLGDMLLRLSEDAHDGFLTRELRQDLGAGLSGFLDSNSNQSGLTQANTQLQRILEEITPGNALPVSEAGEDQVGLLGQTIQLDGSSSYDIGGSVQSYQWIFSQIPSGASVTLSQATHAQTSFTPDTEGLYILTLTVEDNHGDVNSNSMCVIVSGNQVPVASNVSITDANGNNVEIDDVLNGTYTYADADGDPEGSSTYRWLRNGSAISDATSQSYTVKLADNGATLRFEVTPIAQEGTTNGIAVGASIVAETNVAPTATSVTATDANGGSVLVGDQLNGTYTYGDADGDLEGASSFRWLRDGSLISGATAASYVLVAADSGHLIRFEVTPVALVGPSTGSATESNGLSVVNSIPVASSVAITDVNGGTPDVGDSLTGGYTYTDADLDAEGSSTYRWLRDGSAISGATAGSYTLVGDDAGTTIRFEVTPIAEAGANPGLAVQSSGLVIVIPFGVDGTARYLDINANGAVDVGDEIVVMFNAAVTVNSGTIAAFDMEVTNDSFGTGATIAAGPGSAEVTVTLGTSPVLRSRGVFNSGATSAGSASGIDVAAGMPANMLENASGLDAVASIPLDIYPGFVPHAQTLGSSDSSWAVCIDIDADGDLDLIEAAHDSGSNRVYVNNGSGSFSDSGQSLGSNSSYAVVAGDVDGDGDPDLVFSNWLAGNRIYLNNGSGTFSDSGQGLGSDGTMGLDLGDVDGDGDLDLVASNSAKPNRVYLNNGSGVFSDSGQALDWDNSRSIALGDFDNDGDLDMVSGDGGSSGCRILSNNGSGVFTDTGQGLMEGTSIDTWDVVFGDYDGDSDLDIAIAISSNTANRIFFNDGAGTFADSGQTLGAFNSYNMEAVDFDQDGDLDLAVANNSQYNRVYINDGTGTFTDSGLTLGGSTGRGRGVTSGDFDGDGDIDLFYANESNQASKVYTGSLSGSWGSTVLADSGQSLGNASTYGMELGDVDGDGDLDMATGNWGVGNRIYLNNGSGTFTDSAQSLGSSATLGVFFGDIDDDGDLDLVGSNSTLGHRVYTNNGSGVFTDTGQSLSYANGRDLVLADFDGDGDLDMVSADASDGGPQLWLNNGSGVYTDSNLDFGFVVDTWGVATADLDGDQDLDLVFANSSSNGNYVFFNNGAGDFTNSGQSLSSNDSYGVDLGDVDGDGDIDLVIANNGQGNRVYLNNGSGVFSDSAQTIGSSRTRDLKLGDMDGDGDLDLYCANDVGQSDRLYWNNGSGVFSDSGITLGSNNSNEVAMGDIDSDGDLDIAVGQGSSQGNKIYVNQ
jgi:hypothetical protein